jgi:hypothetical protein
MEPSSEDNLIAVTSLKRYREVLDIWKGIDENKTSIHPVTNMLEEFGLFYLKLVDSSKNVSFKVIDKKKYLLAKLKFNF